MQLIILPLNIYCLIKVMYLFSINYRSPFPDSYLNDRIKCRHNYPQSSLI